MIFLLFFIMLFSFCINYYIFHNDLFAPSVMLTMIGCISILFCILNYNKWSLVSFSLKSVIIISIVIISYTLSSFIILHTFCYRKICLKTNRVYKYKISVKWTVFFTLICGVIVYKYYQEVISIAIIGRQKYPIKTYPILWYYKNASFNMHVSSFINMCADIPCIVAYVYTFILAHNIASKNFSKICILYISPILIYCIQSILVSGRTGILQDVSVFLTTLYFTKKKILQSNAKKEGFNFLKNTIPFVILILVAFVALNDISGRVSNMPPFYYLSVYIGSGIKNFDTFLTLNIDKKNELWGINTFANIYALLNRFGFISNYNGVALEFASRINGNYMGNIYTAIRRYYEDFGVAGAVGLSVLSSTIITNIYKKIRSAANLQIIFNYKKYEFLMILYGILMYSIITFFMEDFLFLSFFSLDYFLKMIELNIFLNVIKKMNILQ